MKKNFTLLLFVLCATTVHVNAQPLSPSVAAPLPLQSQANVISLFSDSYTNVVVDTWLTGWSAPAAITLVDTVLYGNNTKKYSNLGYCA